MKKTESALDIARKIDSLNLWDAVARHRWALKPTGTVLPYFCCVQVGEIPIVRARLLLLEGWQVFHDYMLALQNRSYGFYSAPSEFPHFELIVLRTGDMRLARYDPCYMPRDTDERENALLKRILWEVYGVMLRLEADAKLPLRYSGDGAMFARVEAKDGTWADAPLAILPPVPHRETVSIAKDDFARAKDRPFAKDEVIDVDFRLCMDKMTPEPRPRTVYALVMVDGKTGEPLFVDHASPRPEGGIRELWENLAAHLLDRLVQHGRIPGEIRVTSQRVFRMLRVLTVELPFRLSIHDSLPTLEKDFP